MPLDPGLKRDIHDRVADLATDRTERIEVPGVAEMTEGQIIDRKRITDEDRRERHKVGDYSYTRDRLDYGVDLPAPEEDETAEEVDDFTVAFELPDGRRKAAWEEAKGREREVIASVAQTQTKAMHDWIAERAGGDPKKERAIYQLMMNVVRGFVRAELPNASLTDADINALTMEQMMAMRARNAAELVYADMPELNRPLVIGD